MVAQICEGPTNKHITGDGELEELKDIPKSRAEENLALEKLDLVTGHLSNGCGSKPMAPILVGIGMFTGGTIWILAHGQILLVLSREGGNEPGEYLE